MADVLVFDQVIIPGNVGTGGGGLPSAPVFLVRSALDGTVLWNLSPSDTQNMSAAFQPVVAVDANGNGLSDLLVGEYSGPEGFSLSPGWVYAADGVSGSVLWTAAGENAGDAFGWDLAVLGDLNGDGLREVNVDAVTYGPTNIGKQYILGAGGQILATLLPLPGDIQAGRIRDLADIDGDGVSDFTMGGGSLANPFIRIHSGASLGSVVLRVHNALGPAYPVSALGHLGFPVGDTNGDGITEYVLTDPNANTIPGGYGEGRAWQFDGATGSVLQVYDPPSPATAAGFGGWGGPVDDVDGDGVIDFVMSSGAPPGINAVASITHVLSTATGSVLQSLPGNQSTALGDVDLDGRQDFDLGSVWFFPGAPPATRSLWVRRTLTVQTMPGSVAFQASVPGQPGAAYRILVAGSGQTGFLLGTRRIPLDPDVVFLASLGSYALTGVLDGQGQGTRMIAVPADPVLSGMSFVAEVVTFGPGFPFYVKTIGVMEQATLP